MWQGPGSHLQVFRNSGEEIITKNIVCMTVSGIVGHKRRQEARGPHGWRVQTELQENKPVE